MKRYFFMTIAVIVTFVALTSCNSCKYASYTDTINVNGTDLFYICEGKGKPVIILHGNGGSHNNLETTTRQMAQAGYMVYAIDSRGQGANAPLEEYHYTDMATDIKEFIAAKGLKKPAVIGYSDGGIVALQLEVMYPGTLGPIVTAGANIFVEGALKESFLDHYRKKTELKPLQKMIVEEPKMTVDDMKTIKTPALILAGADDIVLPEHTTLIAENIPEGEMLIVSGETHGSYVRNSKIIGDYALGFFDRIGY